MSLVLGSTALLAQAASDDPLLKPIEPEFAQRWLTPQPATRIHGRTWLVGFGGLNVALIKTSAGLILIDGAVPQSVADLKANIRSAGFDIRDVRLILSTEPHYDHAGGLAALARDSGATVLASAPAVAVLRAGRSGADDPQMAWLPPLPSPARLRAVKDGETIRLGDTGVTAIATPGHTAGSMSWRWKSCEEGRCLPIVFASSLNPVAAPGYRFSDPAHAATVRSFRRSIARMKRLDCGILLSAHPDQSGGDAKLARFLQQPRPNPFVDARACRVYGERFEGLLDRKLAEETKASAADHDFQ
ncbi:subclass B3 metallo-beta-lactamase [Rhizorhabdus dicambivorans]|nr:subclass B3 metallo-beta-lactamase [Rhizorhabdus dicambivorans]